MKVRGKFRVESIKKWGKGESGSVALRAVMDDGTDENKRFATATPIGTIEMTVNNPPAFAEFDFDRVFYVDFIPVEEDKENA